MTEEKKTVVADEAQEKEAAEKNKELREAIIELNSSVKYWDMSQTHSCIYPF